MFHYYISEALPEKYTKFFTTPLVIFVLFVCYFLTETKYSQSLLYGHPVDTGTSLLRTVCFAPGEKKPLHFL